MNVCLIYVYDNKLWGLLSVAGVAGLTGVWMITWVSLISAVHWYSETIPSAIATASSAVSSVTIPA